MTPCGKDIFSLPKESTAKNFPLTQESCMIVGISQKNSFIENDQVGDIWIVMNFWTHFSWVFG